MRSQLIARNFTILSIAQVISRSFALVITISITRALGADGFGAIVFATSLLTYGTLLVRFGFDGLGPIEVARGEIPLRSLVQTVQGLSLALMAPTFILLALFVWQASVPLLTKYITLLYGLSLLTDALDLTWVFLGAELMHVTALAEILGQFLLLTGVLLFVNGPHDILLMPLVFLVSRFASIALLMISYARRFGWLRPRIDFTLLSSLFSKTWPFAGAVVVSMFLHNFDIVLIGLWLGLEATGLYGAAYRVVWIPALLLTAYTKSLRPSLARASVQGIASINHLLTRSLQLATAAGVGLAVGGYLMAEPVVLFLYGEEFRGASTPLRLLLAATALLIVNRHYRMLLATFHLQAVMFKMMAIAAGINIILNLLFIERYGINGAALAMMLSEAVILCLGYLFTRQHIGHVPFGRFLWKPAACALLMALVLLTSSSLPLFVRLALGGSSYLVALFALQVVGMDEIRLFQRILLPSRR